MCVQYTDDTSASNSASRQKHKIAHAQSSRALDNRGIPHHDHQAEWASFRKKNSGYLLYTSMALALGGHLAEAVASSRVLVVGTGGIGCELLKNLVLTGFQNIVAVSSLAIKFA